VAAAVTIEEGVPGTRASETRERILFAAMELFAQEGFERATVRSIGERARITDAALYYHFRSKREILHALFDRPQLGRLRDLSVLPVFNRAALERLLDAMLDASVDFDSFIRVLTRQALLDDQTAIELRNQSMAYWRLSLIPHFEASFEPVEAALRADALMMLYLGVLYSGQMDHPQGYGAMLQDAGYRAWVRNMVTACIRVVDGE